MASYLLSLTPLYFSLACTPQESKAEPARPVVAQVRLHDGSVVKIALLQEMITIQTGYGKLSVPTADIRRIEFGLHMPDGAEEQIAAALKKLGSDTYRDREQAVRDLVGFGRLAYLSLQQAAADADPEVVKRASAALKRIDKKHVPGKLVVTTDDTMETRLFTIRGRILDATLKAQSETFGACDLKLCFLRTLQQCSSHDGIVEVTLDSARLSAVEDPWIDSGFAVERDSRLLIQCDGKLDLWPQGPGQYLATPKGSNVAGKGNGHMAGTLLGRIGENGKVFVVGERHEAASAADGKLYLHVVPSPWNSPASGTYRVRICSDVLTPGDWSARR
jgi:hypothetical protein